MGTQTLEPAPEARSDWRRVLVLAGIALAIAFGMDRVILAHGGSVPYTVFWKLPRSAAIKGDFVAVEIAHPIIGPKPALLTKQLVCDAGDWLELKDDAFYCNGVRLGGYITRTWDDHPLQPFVFDGRIPAGKCFVMGTHPRSFDSRYFGLVDKARLVRLMALV